MSRIPRQPPTLSIIPVELRARGEEEARALAYASGEDPDARSLLGGASLAALAGIVALLLCALLR